MSKNQDIWVLKSGRREGPFSLKEIDAQLKAGYFSESALCRRKGESSILRIRDIVAQPDPAPPEFEIEDEVLLRDPLEETEGAARHQIVEEDDDYIYYYEEITEPAAAVEPKDGWYYGKLTEGKDESPQATYEEVEVIDDDGEEISSEEVPEEQESLPFDPNEELFRTRKSRLVYWKQWLTIVAVLLVGLGSASVFDVKNGIIFNVGAIATAIFLFVFMIWIPRILNTYVIYRDHVTTIEGIWWMKNIREVRLGDIKGREVDKQKYGFLGFFDIGDLQLSHAGTDDAEIQFIGVRYATKYKVIIGQLIAVPETPLLALKKLKGRDEG